MSEEACQYNKFCFCKFRESCRRYHFQEQCEQEQCKDKNDCKKRHPKICRKFSSNKGCRFGNDCSYKHSEQSSPAPSSPYSINLASRVKLLETIVEQMAKNIIYLEIKLQESQINKVNIEAEQEELSSNIIKQNNKIIEKSKDLEAHNAIVETEVLVEKLQTSSDEVQSDGQHSEEKNDETPEIILQCKECAYTCKKEVTMKKHVNTKHTKKCKVCDLEFETSIAVLKHVA